jgi:hypothetical protein
MTAVSDLKVGDTVITSSEGAARTIRTIGQVGSLTRLGFDDGTVRLEPPVARYTLTDFATRAAPRHHTVAIELRGSPIRRAYVYVTPGTMFYRDWFTVFTPAAGFDSLTEAQEWLVRVIGYEALDHEIHQGR